jgi:predicted aspartyl protease
MPLLLDQHDACLAEERVMPKLSSKAILVLLAGLLAYGSSACERDAVPSANQPSLNSASIVKPVTAGAVEVQAAQPSPATADKTDKTGSFQLGLERAASAYRISQAAESSDDWRLVAARWQQAINLMKAVPAASSNHAQAQRKLAEYQQNLLRAQQQASRSTEPDSNGVVVVSPSLPASASPSTLRRAPLAAAPRSAPAQPIAQTAENTARDVSSSSNRIFYAPIVRREGNTPVIRVMFNKTQAFDMIVDTGASGTLITRQMAKALNVTPVAQTNVDTASQRAVTFPLGYINSIEVGGATATNLLVAVAGPDLEIGLLGHDFFGRYDVTIRQNEVEFQERSSS